MASHTSQENEQVENDDEDVSEEEEEDELKEDREMIQRQSTQCIEPGDEASSLAYGEITMSAQESELQFGKIVIDGIDMSTFGLKASGSKLLIISQDSVLFHDSIRRKLDSFHDHPYDKLWDSLRRTGLIEESKLDIVQWQARSDDSTYNGVTVGNNDKLTNVVLPEFNLDQTVEDEGSNFSLGERQLIVFARTLVRPSKILIIDEVTSSDDNETDTKM